MTKEVADQKIECLKLAKDILYQNSPEDAIIALANKLFEFIYS
jgi:hypothetical protein